MPVLLTCQQCHRSFTLKASAVAKGRGKYCSVPCKNVALQGRPGSQYNSVECVCLLCHTRFRIRASHYAKGEGKYCSMACHADAMRKQPNTWCDVCGKAFYVSPQKAVNGMGRYCSETCQYSTRGMNQRFWRKVAICDHGRDCPYCCWEWTGRLLLTGYGSVVRKKVIYLSHRIAWELWNAQPIHTGLWVCHWCHRRTCCNPMHLHVGTAQDNMNDSIRDGRMPRGEATVMAILTAQDVRDIRTRYAAGESMYRLHKVYGIHKSHVRDIVRRRIWKHVP